jgi:ABC-type branched-subunit amino acid transport system substrate-binding protein
MITNKQSSELFLTCFSIIFNLHSEGASRYGNTITLPQISYSSTSTTLSDKEEFTYFARTCYSDNAQGRLLAEMLPQVGLSPFVAVISMSSTYATSLSTAFIDR